MPWTPSDAKRHKKGLSSKQARQWSAVANSVLQSCLSHGGSRTSCEARAVRAANSVTGTPARPTSNTTLLVANTGLTVPPQRLKRHGQDYLIAKCVLLVAGVLNQGLVVEDAIVPSDWNYVPITVGHPAADSGLAVSARDPDVLSRCHVGHVFHAQLGQGMRSGQPVTSLIGDLWINLGDVARCGTEAEQAVQMLETQQRLEVSTAFFPDVTPTTGVFLGTPYQEVYTRLRPDHLALLPNAIGACSWTNGGCGAPRLNTCGCLGEDCVCHEGALPMEDQPRSTRWQRFWAFMQEFMPQDDPEEPEEPAPTPVGVRQQEVAAALRRQEDGSDLTHYEQAILVAPETYVHQRGPLIRLGQTDVDLRDALYGQIALEMGQDTTPVSILDIDLAAQTFRYRLGERLCQRSWEVDDGVIELLDDHTDVQRSTTYTPVPHSPAGPHEAPASTPYTEEDAMSTDVIKRRVNALIANERTRWSEDDRHMLEAQNEAFLIRLEQQPVEAPPPPVVESGPEDPTTPEEAIARMPLHLQETMRASYDSYQRRKTALVDLIVNNKQNPFTRDELEALHAERLEKLVLMAGDPLPGQPASSAANYQGRRIPHLRIVTQEGESDTVTPPALPKTMDLVIEEQKKRGIRF